MRYYKCIVSGMEEIADEDNFRTYAMTVAYNGAPFCGFARQPGKLTVQGELESSLAVLFHRDVETVCAGRTDAGVHAAAQVVSFNVSDEEIGDRTFSSLRRSLNALVHDDIVVRSVDQRVNGFSARFDAVAREYRYFIGIDETSPVFMRDFSWHIPAALDVAAMQQGAAYLIGEHDFKSFCLAASAKDKSTCRCLNRIDFREETIMGEHMLVCTVIGNAFLHSMVRAIVGTLVSVGKSQHNPDWVGEVLAACDRTSAGENAPAQGLVLWSVDYGA